MPEEQTDEQNLFDSAFAEATGEKPEEDNSSDEEVKSDQDNKIEKTQDEDTKPEDNEVKDTPSTPEDSNSDNTENPYESLKDEDGEDSKSKPESDDTSPTEDGDVPDYAVLLEEEKQRNRSWEGRINKANDEIKELKEAQEAPQEPEKVKPEPAISEEDTQVAEKFAGEFPDLVRPIEILATQIINQILETQFKTIIPRLDRLDTYFEENSQKTHHDSLDSAHEDWEKIHDSGALQKWIDGKPDNLKNYYNSIVDRGNTEQVIELFDTYKLETKGATKDPEPTTTNPTPPLSKNKDKAENLRAISQSSGGPPKGAPDKNDFDSAWTEANTKK